MSIVDEMKEELGDGFLDPVQRRRFEAAITEIARMQVQIEDAETAIRSGLGMDSEYWLRYPKSEDGQLLE